MPDLTPAQADRLAAIEAAGDAPESLRERVAQAMFDEANPIVHYYHDYWNRVRGGAQTREHYRRLADAALRVITEDARS